MASDALVVALVESGYMGLMDLIERAPHSRVGRINTPAWVRIISPKPRCASVELSARRAGQVAILSLCLR